MAQYHRFSPDAKAPDVAGRIDQLLRWCARQWRQLAAMTAALLVALAAIVWYQQAQVQRAAAASAAFVAAKNDPAKLAAVAEEYAHTVAGQEARFRLARQAFEARDFAKVALWLTPISEQARFPLFQAAATMWIAASAEAQGDWDAAEARYRRVLAIKGPGIDHDRALRNLVRVLKRAGKTAELRSVLDTTKLTETKATEELWLAIDPGTTASVP